MNPDGYNFTAECPFCKETRSVACSRSQAKTGQPIEVFAIHCGHNWKLTPEHSKKLLNHLSLLTDSEKQYEDSHITLRLLDFDPTTGRASLAIDEQDSNVGFYYIWVRFASGNETRIDYDGGNPRRDLNPVVVTAYPNDVIREVTVKRVRD
jgi:hypothetical protein